MAQKRSHPVQDARCALGVPRSNRAKVRLTVAADYAVDALKPLGTDKVSFAYLAPWIFYCDGRGS